MRCYLVMDNYRIGEILAHYETNRTTIGAGPVPTDAEMKATYDLVQPGQTTVPSIERVGRLSAHLFSNLLTATAAGPRVVVRETPFYNGFEAFMRLRDRYKTL